MVSVDFMILSFLSFFYVCFVFGLVSTKAPAESSKTAQDSTTTKSAAESEFISDKFKTTKEQDLVEVQENMTKLGLTGKKDAKAGERKTSTVGKQHKGLRVRHDLGA